MKLIADNGGSKSDWAFIENKRIFSGPSINLFSSDENIVLQIKNIIPSDLLISKGLIIDFYTAGLSDFIKLKLSKIFVKFFKNIKINIFSDMLAASRALFKKQNGIACILGTGSNCAYFDGVKNHKITRSLGYLLGDEGSGYYLGRELLVQYCQNKLPSSLTKILEGEKKINKEKLISNIYSIENPKFYIASFSIFLKNHESNPFIQKIIHSSILKFLATHPFKYPNFCDYRFGFVGSVAFNFNNYIYLIMKEKGIKCIVLQKPIENLVDYYLE